MIGLDRREYYANAGGEQRQSSPLLLTPGQAEQVHNIEFLYPGSFERAPGYVKINPLDGNGAPDPYLLETKPVEFIGAFDYQLSSGAQHILVAARANASPTLSAIMKVNPTTGAATILTPVAADPNLLGTSFSRIRFVQLEDIAIGGCDQHPPYYWDGTISAMRRLGLPPVAENYGAIASQTTGGGLPDGTYRFRFTYYTTETGTANHEGRIADAQLASETYCEVTVTAGGGTARVALAMPALDSTTTGRYGQITGRSVYMTLDQGSIFYWVADTTNAGAHTVNVDALPVTAGNASAPNAINDLPPHASLFTLFMGRVIAANGRSPNYSTGQAGATAENDRVWPSLLALESTGKRTDGKQQFPQAMSFRIDPGAGEPLTGFFILGGQLFAAKRRKIYRIYSLGVNEATGYEQFTYEPVEEATGCICPDSIVNTETLPYFVSERLVYRFAGRQVDPVGNPEESAWAEDLNIKRLELSVGAYERAPQRNRYRLLCSTVGAPTNKHDLMLEHDIRTGAWRRRNDFPPMSFMFSVEQTTGEDLLYSCDYEGFIYRWDPSIYNYGAGIQDDAILTGTATSGTATAINDTGKAWKTNEFKNVPVRIIKGTGRGQRGVVSSNTATKLTFPASTFSPAPDATSVYHIGGYRSRYRARWEAFDKPAHPKRYRELGVTADVASKATQLSVFLRFNFEQGDGEEHFINLVGPGAVFDTAVFDVDVFGGLTQFQKKFGIGRKANWLQPIFQNDATNAPFRAYGWWLDAQVLSHKRAVPYAEAQAGVI